MRQTLSLFLLLCLLVGQACADERVTLLQEDVLGLDVAVDQPTRMQVAQAVQDVRQGQQERAAFMLRGGAGAHASAPGQHPAGC